MYYMLLFFVKTGGNNTYTYLPMCVKNTEKMQKKIIKVTTLREVGAEMGVQGQEQNFTLYLFVLF